MSNDSVFAIDSLTNITLTRIRRLDIVDKLDT